MNTFFRFCTPALLLAIVALAGCSGKPNAEDKAADQASQNKTPAKGDGAAETRASLEKLPPEDRKFAEEQGFCAVETKNPLGSMGVPVKVTIKEQPVFLCCAGCEKKAKAHADRTLAKVKELKETRGETPPK